MKKLLISFIFISLVNTTVAQDLISGGSNSWIFHTPDNGSTSLSIAPKINDAWNWDTSFVFYNDGNSFFKGYLGIGKNIPIAPIHIKQDESEAIRFDRNNHNTYKIYLGDSKGLIFHNTTDGRKELVFDGNGNIGIGTVTMGSHKLAVEGSIGSREIKVEATGWSDFVFFKDYKLPTLEEVEQHIKEKGHLKDIPSAKEVEKNGIFLGEMNAKLLQKIEELTLYTIAQEKKLKEQKEKLEKEKERTNALEERLSKIEEFLKQ